MDGGAVEFKDLRAGFDRCSECRYPFLIDRTRLKIDGLVGLVFQHDLIVEKTACFDRLWDFKMRYQTPRFPVLALEPRLALASLRRSGCCTA